jgi:uncharacterized protein YndB with AHSA1/START domain
MTDAHSRASTLNSKFIKATPEALYRAFTDPAALAVWLAPGDMTGEVHSFDCRVGGGYRMSLYYPLSENTFRGKTEDREDRYTARFVELTPPRRIVEAITFDSVDPVGTESRKARPHHGLLGPPTKFTTLSPTTTASSVNTRTKAD